MDDLRGRILDIGCGENKYDGAIGIDFAPTDITHDLNEFPYPLGDGSFDVILLNNIIEHIPNIVGLMGEVHRIGRHGASVMISTPHFSSLTSYQDPTHVRHMSLGSMDYFIRGTDICNFDADKRFEMVKKRIDFGRSLIARWLFKLSPDRYEKRFAFVFPADQLHFHMQVIKQG